LNVFVASTLQQRADGVHQPSSAQSSLANTLRAGLRVNEEWRDSNSFVYTDPRYDGMKFTFSIFHQIEKWAKF
jgi:hypothetical protein